MLKFVRIMLLVVSISFLSACTIPECVELTPQVVISGINLGHGAVVAVRVIDARPEAHLGGRRLTGASAAKISLADSIQRAVRRTVWAGLKTYNFLPKPYWKDAKRRLTLCVLALDYQQTGNFLISGVNISSTIEVTAVNSGKTFNRTYQGGKNTRILFTPTQSTDKDRINAVLSDTLGQMLNDKQLMHFLAPLAPKVKRKPIRLIWVPWLFRSQDGDTLI